MRKVINLELEQDAFVTVPKSRISLSNSERTLQMLWAEYRAYNKLLLEQYKKMATEVSAQTDFPISKASESLSNLR